MKNRPQIGGGFFISYNRKFCKCEVLIVILD